ncbi:hypothetical protein [Alkalihalobacillus sp. LMS39]|uniref:hypothetical protein n=1 Tax=Alkalihalobacillus sp. LMS39 TaxID=2924032 RepID=UPI001FB4079D|nr:hypothetical protein [Alkalihalobacillus sp. LMS39]UOE92558.1 hypothetical protein MM271_15090 [Alkalihalobacillus sp. LMS39]
MRKKKPTKHEALLWTIALPGFGQFLNGKIIKGILFSISEVVINVLSRFNLAILYSFNWNIQDAIDVIDYQWLMFYPCLYMFSLWDAYSDAEGESPPHFYLPFVFGAYFVTIGLMYSERILIFGILFGPVFLPILFLPIGLFIGTVIRRILLFYQQKKAQGTE